MSEPKFEGQNQEKFITLEESLQIASDLIERHSQELQDMNLPPSLIKNDLLTEDDKKGMAFGKSAIRHFIQKVPRESAKRFSGHGIFRNGEPKDLSIFINILQNKTMKGESAPLVESGYYDADASGDFLIISHIDKPLVDLDDDGNQKDSEMGWAINAGAYVVNAKLYPIINDLKEMFPDANIIKANELLDYVKREEDVR